MKVGLAITRCGEWQCSRTLADVSKFHCVHVVNNVSPNHVACNEALKRCFDDGAEWVVLLDGDMYLNDNFWPEFEAATKKGRSCIYFRLHDPYINKDIYALKVMKREWLEAGGWFQNQLCADRGIKERAQEAGLQIYDAKTVVATHFDSPTHFQVFRRFYVRGIKAKAGYRDDTGIDYASYLQDRVVAFDAYKMGYRAEPKGNPHDLQSLLTTYNQYLASTPYVCGMCAWGNFPYHFQQDLAHCQHKKPSKDSPIYISEKDFDPDAKMLYINRLAIGISQNMSVPHKLFYLSPEPIDGVIPECQWVKLESPYNTKNLKKLGMYNPKFLANGDYFIVFDLDNVPLDDLTPMFEAVKSSNGWLCRSERLTLGKNIPGGDMIGYSKTEGLKLWDWLKTLPESIIQSGAERFVYREYAEQKPEHSQYWWEFLGENFLMQWKRQVRQDPSIINCDCHLLSVWGEWTIDQIHEKRPANRKWTNVWLNRYITGESKVSEIQVSAYDQNPKAMITMLVPTFGRLEMCKRLVESAMITASGKHEIRWLFGLNDTDSCLHDYLTTYGGSQCVVTEGDTNYAAQINKLSMLADYSILWHGNDDVIFHTKDWDIKVAKSASEYDDNIFLIFGEDGFKRKQPKATLPFSHKRLSDIMGGIFHYLFAHNGCDTFLHDILSEVGRSVFHGDLYVEHQHVNRTGITDDTYKKTQDRRNTEFDAKTYNQTGYICKRVADLLRRHMNTINAINTAEMPAQNNDLTIWEICRSQQGHHHIFVAASEKQLPVWKDSDGLVLYRRDDGVVVRVRPDKCLPHPNCLPVASNFALQ